jgi:pimeloyl-ACP methyl ester carboxylesterase
MYPQDVCGLVLVDPAHAELVESAEDLKAWFAAHHPGDWSRVEAVAARVPEGSQTMVISGARAVEEFLDKLPDSRRDAVAGEFWSLFENVPKENLSPDLTPGARDEFKVILNSFRQAIAARPLPKVPTILLAAGQPMLYSETTASLSPNMRVLHQFQKNWKIADYQKWVDATPGAKLIVARQSGHNIQTEDPQLVIDSIREVTENAARAGK